MNRSIKGFVNPHHCVEVDGKNYIMASGVIECCESIYDIAYSVKEKKAISSDSSEKESLDKYFWDSVYEILEKQKEMGMNTRHRNGILTYAQYCVSYPSIMGL